MAMNLALSDPCREDARFVSSPMHPWIIAALLGLIEGLTEFLPVSSTGHLLIAEHWLGAQTQLFNVVIQPAAALALLPIFWTKLTRIALNLGEPRNKDLVLKLAAAFGVTVIGGLIMKKMHVTLPKEIGPVAWATLIGGFVIILIELTNRGRAMTDSVSWTIAIAFGLAQLIAIAFPGASRSGTTIMLAMVLGLTRPAATEFSFLLGIPTLFAAGAKELKDALEEAHSSIDWASLGIGALCSFISAFIVVKWLITFVKTHTFTGLAVYRIVLGAALLFLIARGW